MTVLVISDVHGRGERVEELLARGCHYDGIFFLGDGIRGLNEELCRENGRMLVTVRGNCDGTMLDWMAPEERILSLGEYTVLMMHGHTHGVKHGVERAAAYAASKGADLLLYGHTHIPEEQYLPEGTELLGVTLKKPLRIMNPGSLGEPTGARPSFGVIELRRGQMLLSHGQL